MRPRIHKVRRVIGAVLFSGFVFAGLSITLFLFVLAPMLAPAECPDVSYWYFMLIGAGLALPAVLAYMLVPVVLDRFDPEPWWALVMALVWGGGAAAGLSAAINTLSGAAGSVMAGDVGEELMSAVISAPFVEEFWKGLFVLGVMYFLRTEFDGIVDGVIYATFVALGFASIENIVYYSNAGYTAFTASSCVIGRGNEAMVSVFFLRGVVSPWIHPLFTSMTGIGIGIARETNRTWLKVLAPMVGFFTAVTLHAVWNGSAMLSALLGVPLILLIMLLYIIFVMLFIVVVIVLVVREGRIVRDYLRDEVAMGVLTKGEFEMVCSPIGRVRGLISGGLSGRRFVQTCATLAFKKWHVTRATKGKKHTVSFDFIEPLRQEIAELRQRSGFAPILPPNQLSVHRGPYVLAHAAHNQGNYPQYQANHGQLPPVAGPSQGGPPAPNPYGNSPTYQQGPSQPYSGYPHYPARGR